MSLVEQISLAGFKIPADSLFNSKFKIDKKKRQSVLDLKGGRCDNLNKLNLLLNNRLWSRLVQLQAAQTSTYSLRI